jgi:hypothetical protein
LPDVTGKPLLKDAAGDWFRDIVRALQAVGLIAKEATIANAGVRPRTGLHDLKWTALEVGQACRVARHNAGT